MTTTIVDENQLFTARKRSLGRGNMFTDVCLSTGGYLVPGGLPDPGGSGPRGVPGGDPPRMATAAGGMHATAMHSCLLQHFLF